MYKEIKTCRCCGHGRLYTYLDLTDQPLANSFHDGKEDQPCIPLKANLCERCYHSQLSVVVDPKVLYKNYLYVSGTSNTLKEYFKWFAFLSGQILDHVQNDTANPRILDIACNDGSQLDAFRARGWETWGVDPAENITPTARAKGHKVLDGFWNTDLVNRSIGECKLPRSFDIITAQNVFAHTDDVLRFLDACATVMHDKSVLMIQTSQCDMFVNGEFDTMYHEHLSFFNVSSMKALCERHGGLVLERVFKTNIHGGSYVFMITRSGNLLENNVREAYNAEFMLGLYNTATYDDFAKRAKKVVDDLKAVVDMAIINEQTVIGYGAAAKGMTVLNFGGIKLHYIIDDAPLKQGLLTPGMNIPIKSIDALAQEENPVVFVPLAWNFYKEIRERIKKVRENPEDTFVRYFPKLVVES